MRHRVSASALAILALVLSVALGAAPAGAVPAMPGAVKELHQPDGSKVRGHLFGDEWQNGYESDNGYTLARDRDSGYWEYAEKDSRGRLVASGRRPGRDAPKGAPHLRDDTAEPLPQPAPTAGSTLQRAAQPVNTGTQRALVILVSFTDQPSLGSTAANWNARYFGTNNSLAHYSKQVSYNNLTIAPAAENCGTANDGVAGWFRLDRAHPRVAQLDETSDDRAQQTVRDAIDAANACVNYASFDTDRDGQVEPTELHITVIPAGWEAAMSCAPPGEPSVWGHKFGTYQYLPTVDNVKAGVTYTMFGEMHCESATEDRHPATLGIIAHEMGHDLGWPDLYDYDKSSTGGVGDWSIMGSGTWLALPTEFAGGSPSHPDAYLKAYQGWITPTLTTGTVNAASLPQAATNPVARQLRANANGIDWTMDLSPGTGEYFLLENRQKTGYDRALPGCGIAIWHISEAVDRFAPNQNEPRRLIDLEEADGDTDSPTDATDLWTGAKTFGNASVPNSKLYDATTSGVSANGFSACGATMTANLTGPADTTPPPPAGDSFGSPQIVTSGAYTKTGLSTVNATAQPGETTSCTVTGTTTTRSYGKTMWFKYTPGTSGNATVDTAGSDFDTVMAGYEGTTLGGLVRKACNDDTTTPQAKFTLPVTAGRTYYFQVGGYQAQGAVPESGSLSFKLTGPAPGTVATAPANDAFASARTATTLPFAPATLSTAAATTQTSEKTSCTPPGAAAANYGKTVWFKYVPPVDMTIDASTAGSNFNTVMALYSGTTLSGLSVRGCNNDATTSTTTSRLRTTLGAGVTYYFQVGGFRTTSTGTPAGGTLKFALSGIPRANAFAYAQRITALPYTKTQVDTTKMTVQAGEPTSCTPRNATTAAPLGKTIWLTYTPATTGYVTAYTSGSTYDTVMGVYSGTTLANLVAVGCNDDVDNANSILTSKLRFNAVAGRKYYFQVGGYRNPDTGAVTSGLLSFRLAAS